MFDRIIVPLDGSEMAEKALPVAVALARTFNARLLLFQATPLEWWLVGEPTQMSIALGPDVIEAFLADARAYLERVADRWRQPKLKIDTDVAVGLPTAAIVDRAAAEPGTLVVMTTHGRTGLSRTVLGSVAMGVVGAKVSPVLLIRPGARQPESIRRILVLLDGSQAAESVLSIVGELARALDGTIILCRVRLPDELPNDVHHYLNAVAERIRQQGLAVEIRPVDDPPATAIVETARLVDADLIAMTTHGRTSLGALIYGSVAERVLADAPLPVLLVKR